MTGERGLSLVGETAWECALVGDVFERVGEDPGPSSVLADLLPTLLFLVPLKVLILKIFLVTFLSRRIRILFVPWAAE